MGGSLPFILADQNFDEAMGSGTLPPLGLGGILLIAYAPTLAALFVTALTADAGGKNNLLWKLTNWRVAPAWYALVLLAPFVMVLAADGIYALAGGASPRAWLVVPDTIATSAFWGPLVAGSLGEEPGWRGFALPRLQSRLGALPASILIGILWGTWHLWPAITPGGVAHLTAANLVQTYLRLISTSILYAWLFNSTNGSLVLMMVAHAGHNLAIDFVPMPEKGAPVVALIVAFLYMAAALAVVLSTDPRTLTRAKSGG
ncbi:MAG TPA: type II CAAX endopeptidase family protein [Pirellulales bacterium]|nr:type II CAAX endopeptidase family protein [Pirellulales bacterium]